MFYEIQFLIALGLTTVLEVFAVVLLRYFFFRKIGLGKTVFVTVIASILTLPYLWFIFPAFLSDLSYEIFGELFVFVVELFLYFILLDLKFFQAVILSLVANVFSYLFGGMIF